MSNFKNDIFAVFDVETTGLSPRQGDRIIEIAVVKIRNYKIIDRYESLVDPERDISYGAYLVNGITQDMLNGAPRAEEIMEDILRFIKDCTLVAHNIRFDMSFLNHECDRAGFTPMDNVLTVDTVKMARRLVPGLRRYSLSTVAMNLGIEDPQQHRAMSDVEMTSTIFQKLLKIADRRDISDLESLNKHFGIHSRASRKSSMTLRSHPVAENT